MFGFYHYDPQQHEVIRPEILDWCKRQASKEDLRSELFMYRHRKYKTFVIARWLGHPHGLFTDLLNLGESLANFTRAKAQEFLRRTLCPLTATETSRAISNCDSDFDMQQQVELQNEQERLIKRHERWGY